MPEAKIHSFTGYQNTSLTLISRVVDLGQAVLTQATTKAITCTVFDGEGTQTNSPTVIVNKAIFDSLQTDSKWTKDSTGYNFKFEVPGGSFPSVGTYRIVFKFELVSGENFPVIYEGPIISVYPETLDPVIGTDFRSIKWCGETYSFTGNQAPVVELLYQNWKQGTLDVGDETLLSAVDPESPPNRLNVLFRDHPAWGKIIVPGKTKGSHRLSPPKKT